MRHIKIKATFIGRNGSCGYITGLHYILDIRHGPGANIVIEDDKGGGYCEYTSMLSFLENWTAVFNL